MAEAAAIVGLVASIGSLVDLSAKVVSRLHEFTSKSSDVPESFRSLSTRLPLLTEILQRIQSQGEAGRLPDDVTKALKAIVDNTSEQVSTVQISLSKVLPSHDAPKLERALKALKSLAKEHEVQQVLEKIHKNNDLLVLHQTTRHVDTGDRILEELSKLSISPLPSSKSFGVCLGQASQIAPNAFVGRTNELQQLQDWLSPKNQPDRQRIISIVGMGGMGKTQLSLAHVRDCASDYSSVFWVNAKDETSLRKSIADLSALIFPATASTDDEELKINKIRGWLSVPGNDQWLLIFDNYDDPRLPGMDSTKGYDVRTYFPHRAQGSILITTRSPQLVFAEQLPLRKLEEVEQSLAILAVRSRRKVDGDASAIRLAQRLDGLPLALATAGACLRQSADSFDDYLEQYNNSWSELREYSPGPVEYEERTLYTTWNISFHQVHNQDLAAAELLKLMAYLDNQDLWYELFHVDVSDAPAWWLELQKSRVRFNHAISILHNYSLLEVNAGRYSLHLCEHDWTLEYLNDGIDQERCRIAVHCAAANMSWKSEARYWVRNRRLLPHIRRFQHARIKAAIDWNGIESRDLSSLAYLYEQNHMNAEAEQIYRRALDRYEKACGPDHIDTLHIVNNLGVLCSNQSKYGEAEQMYRRALDGIEKILGPDHTHTLFTVNNLAGLYKNQGKYGEAEQIYRRVLDGREKALGPDHEDTLCTVHKLGVLYVDQSKYGEAEQMYQRALDGYEKVLGPDHRDTLCTVHNLGLLYKNQSKYGEAEQMYQRALDGMEKVLGPDHTDTLATIHNLGVLYVNQSKYGEAEQIYQRVLDGYEKVLGPDHTDTLSTVNNLGVLYFNQSKYGEAEQMYQRALDGKEKVLGPDHTDTLSTVNNLGVLYKNQGKYGEAEQMYQRALDGFKKQLAPDHPSTLLTIENLRLLDARRAGHQSPPSARKAILDRFKIHVRRRKRNTTGE